MNCCKFLNGHWSNLLNQAVKDQVGANELAQQAATSIKYRREPWWTRQRWHEPSIKLAEAMLVRQWHYCCPLALQTGPRRWCARSYKHCTRMIRGRYLNLQISLSNKSCLISSTGLGCASR